MRLWTEADVVECLSIWLDRRGWTIESQGCGRRDADDIMAIRDGCRLGVEVMGGTSSRVGTAHYGERFGRAAHKTNLGRAIVRAMQRSAQLEMSAIAFPDGPEIRPLLDEVAPNLWAGGVTVFIVCDDGSVEERIGGRWNR